MGRDFYDAIFLLGKTKPNIEFLKLKLGIKDSMDLKNKILLRCNNLNFKQLAADVEQFLFVPGDSKKVLFFRDYIKNYKF